MKEADVECSPCSDKPRRYHVLVPVSSPAKTITDLRGAVVEDSRYATKQLLNTGGVPGVRGGVELVKTLPAVEAVRLCATGKPRLDEKWIAAVVLDESILNAMTAQVSRQKGLDAKNEPIMVQEAAVPEVLLLRKLLSSPAQATAVKMRYTLTMLGKHRYDCPSCGCQVWLDNNGNLIQNAPVIGIGREESEFRPQAAPREEIARNDKAVAPEKQSFAENES